jgi:hypothetical protein
VLNSSIFNSAVQLGRLAKRLLWKQKKSKVIGFLAADGRTALAYKAEHAVDMDTGTHGGAFMRVLDLGCGSGRGLASWGRETREMQA